MTHSDLDRIRGELDRLCELANIGGGHAANALATLLGCTIRMDPPRARVGVRGGPMTPVPLGLGSSGVFFDVEGAMGGTLGVLFPTRSRLALLATLLRDGEPQSEEAESALREVGNILASHALSAVADLIGSRVLPSLPVLASEAAGAVLASYQAAGEPVRIESRLVDDAGVLRALLVWIPGRLESTAKAARV